MKQPNDTEDFATLLLEDLRPVLEDPGFNTSMVILLLSLPDVARDCRAVPLEQAFELLDALQDETEGTISVERIEEIKRHVDEVRARGQVAVVNLWAREQAVSIWCEGIAITAAAKA